MSAKTLKSVHITNYYHRNSGGISTSFNNLMAAAERLGREIAVIVPGEEDGEERVNPCCTLHYVKAGYSPLFDRRYRLILPWQYMPGGSRIRKILLNERPDMVEVTDKYTLSMLGAMVRIGKFKQLGRPMLVHFSAERMDDNIRSFMTERKYGRRLARRVMSNYLLPSFDFHLANSAYTAAEFHEAFGKDPEIGRNGWFLNKCWRSLKAPMVPVEERIFVCPRGVNTEHFRADLASDETKQEMRRHAGIPAGSTVLLYAGRLSPEKNITLLADMMKILAKDASRDYRLVIAGAGPLSEWLEEQTALHFPRKAVQLGHLDKQTLAKYYANCDVFVHPNPREPFGIAPLEAMVSGAPTLAPNSGGILSYATENNCWLRNPSGEDFAGAVREIMDDPRRTGAKVEAAVETALANSREKSTDNLFATYDRMYEDFCSRRELFTDVVRAKTFDYVRQLGL